ncbi:hypothetical protein KI387_005536 [Taxus chinensis]|uniref:Uncharacterized protein n=1 Tax=Taxus chinensis TaxID=29808 RepID=A0AA38GNG1_TAXCH|nr:hypothetical protein KI387_005536 [Taxus chinensis]
MQNAKPVSTPMAGHFKLSKDQCPSSHEEVKYMTRVSYASAVGSLMYAMVCTRPDIAQAVGVVSRYMANPEAEYVAATEASKEMIWMSRFMKELGKEQDDCKLFSDSQSAIHLEKNSVFHSRTKHIQLRYHFIRQMGEGKSSTVLMIFVFVIDVIAFGLAVAAEQRRSTAKVVPDSDSTYTYCVYDSDISTGYGVGAFLFLLLSQVLIMGVTRCLCCGRSLRPGGSRAWSIVLFIATWLTFVIAEACFVGGAARNAYHTKYRGFANMTDLSCETLRKGVFAAGAAFTVFTLILSELYYMSFSKANEGGWTPYGRESAIGMSSYP